MPTVIDGKYIDADSIPLDRLKEPTNLPRSRLAQVENAIKRITPFDWRVWDSGALLGAAGNDDLGIVVGTFGTGVVTVQAGDVKTLTGTRRAITHVALPENYDNGASVTIRLRAGMETTVSDTSCTIDVECYKVGDDGLVDGADLCATAAQSINSLTEADKDFTITPSTLEAGDVLELRISVAYVDSATGTAVTPAIYLAALLCDVRG